VRLPLFLEEVHPDPRHDNSFSAQVEDLDLVYRLTFLTPTRT
jgi:hypothetical protein